MEAALALAGCLALALVHVFAGRLTVLDVVPRSQWLSAAGGISVAYVIVHVLPELGEAQEAVDDAAHGLPPFLERHVYLLALAGLAAFYGVERAAQRSRARSGGEHGGGLAFSASVVSFAFFNLLVGYLLVHRAEESATAVGSFAFAMALHFLVNDVGLRAHYRDLYRARGRWILAAAPVAGWLLAIATEVSDAALAVPFAFVAGGIILNVLKEELPPERESRFGAFVVGAAAYAALLVAL